MDETGPSLFQNNVGDEKKKIKNILFKKKSVKKAFFLVWAVSFYLAHPSSLSELYACQHVPISTQLLHFAQHVAKLKSKAFQFLLGSYR